MEIWVTPHGFLKAARANNATSQPANGGSTVTFAVAGKKYVGSIDVQNQVEHVQTWIDNPVLGDTPVETTFSDYRDFGGVMFPGHIVRTQGAHPVLDITVSEVKLNPAVDLPVPDQVKNFTPPPVQVNVQKLADGVYYLTGANAHTIAIDQSDHIVVVEAPAERGALAGGDRQDQGNDPEQADPLRGQHPRALRPLGRPAHVRGRGRHDRDAPDEQAVLRAGVGRAADAQPRPARAVEEGREVQTFSDERPCRSLTASFRRARSIIHVILKDEVATCSATMPLAAERLGAAAQVLERRVDASPDHADGAERVNQADPVAEALGKLRAKSILLVQVLARDHERERVAEAVKLFAGDRELVEQREDIAGSAGPVTDVAGFAGPTPTTAHVAFAGDAHHGPGRPHGVAADDGPVSDGSAPRQRRRRRARVDRDPFLFRELHRLRVQHLRARFGELLRFFVRQRGDPFGVADHARIRRIHAVDVRADLAVFGAERGRHRDGGRVAAAAAERRDLAPIRHALDSRR